MLISFTVKQSGKLLGCEQMDHRIQTQHENKKTTYMYLNTQ